MFERQLQILTKQMRTARHCCVIIRLNRKQRKREMTTTKNKNKNKKRFQPMIKNESARSMRCIPNEENNNEKCALNLVSSGLLHLIQETIKATVKTYTSSPALITSPRSSTSSWTSFSANEDFVAVKKLFDARSSMWAKACMRRGSFIIHQKHHC